MKAKISEQPARFIECENCGFDRSFLLERDVKYNRFDWNCPKCDQHWGGLFQRDGSILIGQLPDRETRLIVMELAEPWAPYLLQAKRRETDEEMEKRNGSVRTSVTRNFYLAPCAPDAEENPKGLEQYKARDF